MTNPRDDGEADDIAKQEAESVADAKRRLAKRSGTNTQDDGEAVALIGRLRARTITSLPRDWYKGRKCPEMGCLASAERPKCVFELGGACPRLDPDAYDKSPYVETPDQDCVAAADLIATISRQLAEARAERDRIIEDRARFPDRPDDIGRMIQAHIGNLKAGKEAADEHARNAFAKLQVVRADLAEAHGVIAALVADIEDYERVNNLAPSPGKRDCWQSVTHAKDVLAQSAALRTEK